MTDYVTSLQAYKYCEEDTLVVPSYGLPFRGIKTRVDSLETHHEDRMNDLYGAVLESPKTAAELIPTLFRRKLDNHQLFFAIAEAVAHVNHGWRIGRLTREVGEDGRIRFGLVGRVQSYPLANTASRLQKRRSPYTERFRFRLVSRASYDGGTPADSALQNTNP